MASNQLCTAYPVIRFSPTWWDIPNNGASRVIIIGRNNDNKQTVQRRTINNENRHKGARGHRNIQACLCV